MSSTEKKKDSCYPNYYKCSISHYINVPLIYGFLSMTES